MDIGDFPDDDETDVKADPTRPVRLTAHIVARLADRVPLSRKFSRHMEGTDNRAGILSDIFALIAELVRRNPHLVESRLESFGDELQKVRAQRADKSNSTEAQNNHAA